MSTATKKKTAKPKAAAKPKAKKPEGFSAEHPAPEPEAVSAVAEPTPAAPAQQKKLTLEERVHRLEQFVRHDLNAILDQPERTPGGPAGDGAGEEQVVGNT